MLALAVRVTGKGRAALGQEEEVDEPDDSKGRNMVMNPRYRLGDPVVRYVRYGMLALCCVLALASYGAAADTGAKWEKTLAAARAEGQVNIYGGDRDHPSRDPRSLSEALHQDQGGERLSGHSELIQRIIAERRARKYLVDLFSYGPNAPADGIHLELPGAHQAPASCSPR